MFRYPSETFDYFTMENCAKDAQNRRYAEFLLRHRKGRIFRNALRAKPERLVAMVSGQQQQQQALTDRHEVQFAGLRYIWLICKQHKIKTKLEIGSGEKESVTEEKAIDEDVEGEDGGEWIAGRKDVVDAVRKIWNDEAYHARHKR
jgi:hypothetical protein